MELWNTKDNGEIDPDHAPFLGLGHRNLLAGCDLVKPAVNAQGRGGDRDCGSYEESGDWNKHFR